MSDSQNPIATVQDAVSYITCVQKPIVYRWGTKDDPARYWEGLELDGLILGTPDHLGRPQEIAREVYHRLVARFVAANAAGKQRQVQSIALVGAVLGPLIFVFATVGSAVLAGILGEWVAKILPLVAFLAGPVGLWLYSRHVWASAPGWMCTPEQLAQYKKDAEGAVRRCFLKGFPPDTPPDLSDVWRHGWLTSDGRPVSSELVETDATSLVALEIAEGWRSACKTILFLAGISAMVCVPLIVCPLLMLLGAFAGKRNPGQLRAMELDRRQAVEGPLLVSAGGIEWAMHQEQAWMKQIVEARSDKTPILHLGEATGILAGRGDFYAPSAGLPFDLSLRDLQNHLVVLGGTGSGKTSGVLRPLAHQIGALKNVGLVVMDGKAALPFELKGLPGMKVVDPATERFSLVAGLSPAEIVDTLADVLRSEREADPFWGNSAMELLRHAAIIAYHAGGDWWTLEGIMKIASSDSDMLAAKESFPERRMLTDPLLEAALHYFPNDWRPMDPKPKSGIISHARSWVSVITAHPDLLAWAKTRAGQDSFDLLTPLEGGRIGFLIPAHRYGRAGAVVTALLKARIYASLKKRAERTLEANETPVVFIIDEAQEVATRDDATMLSIGRSLGLAMVGATQTIEGVTEKLGDKAAAKWLAVYGNAIALPGRSKATDVFIADRAGASWRARVTGVPGISVRDSITASIFTGSVASARRQVSMRRFASPAPTPIAPFLQNSQNAAVNRQHVSPDPRVNREGDTGVVSSLNPHPLILPEEISTLLAEPNLALAVTTRARVPRRDVVMLQPRFD